MEISGVTIRLVVKTETGRDALNHPLFEEELVEVNNVLIGDPTTDDITNSLSLYGKKAAYKLGIPKGDEHQWENADVILPEPFGGRFRTIGYPTAGIEANIPLQWNKKVLVERYG